MRFEVRGVPVPQGSIRHLGRGRPAVHSNAKTLEPWRKTVQWAAEEALGTTGPITGPVRVEMTFTVPKPLSAPKRRRTWPTARPDVDKLVRAVGDALTAAGAWHDDAQIVELTARKVYPGEGHDALPVPGAVITVTPANVKAEPVRQAPAPLWEAL